MSRAAGVAKRREHTHAGARIPTELYRRVTSKVAAEGTTLRQLIIDCFSAYVDGAFPPHRSVREQRATSDGDRN